MLTHWLNLVASWYSNVFNSSFTKLFQGRRIWTVITMSQHAIMIFKITNTKFLYLFVISRTIHGYQYKFNILVVCANTNMCACCTYKDRPFESQNCKGRETTIFLSGYSSFKDLWISDMLARRSLLWTLVFVLLGNLIVMQSFFPGRRWLMWSLSYKTNTASSVLWGMSTLFRYW